MTKRLIGGLAAALMTALAAPALFAAPASAQVSTIEVHGMDWGLACYAPTSCKLIVVLTGADRGQPVTIQIDGVAVATGLTPTVDGTKAYANYNWSPEVDKTYTITAIQGASTKTATLTLPGELGGTTPKVTTGSAVFDALMALSYGSAGK
ncbi:hypothetical protein [Nocardia yamanashiensis]|uniref:hypothetical protein n=1 Tax=Nocardia yamanashiensis TaxID=209247 RepID=UPI00083305AE|nr:hypothetical protein [Nocardia yamanashiensis]